jgi:hypothetical protein
MPTGILYIRLGTSDAWELSTDRERWTPLRADAAPVVEAIDLAHRLAGVRLVVVVGHEGTHSPSPRRTGDLQLCAA